MCQEKRWKKIDESHITEAFVRCNKKGGYSLIGKSGTAEEI